MSEPGLRIVLHDNGRLLRRDQGRLVDETGQMYFDFAVDHADAEVSANPVRGKSARQWFEVAFTHEQRGELEEAAAAYRQSLLCSGPQADVSFNLANVLYGLGRTEQAVERYWQAVEVDSEYAEAWHNLGVLLAELGQTDQAVAALETAVRVAPEYADAHFSLADALEDLGRQEQARVHWQTYLHSDRDSERGQFARQRLATE